MLAACLLELRRIPGVRRPGIAVTIPARHGPSVLIDAGANADARPEDLLQFAQMGAVFAEEILDVRNPKIRLLSIGEEPEKGNQLTLEAHDLLAQSELDFAGNTEGRDLLSGAADVVVTDGFTGNVALKTIEGTARVVGEYLKRALYSSTRAKLGGLLAKSALDGMKKRMDWREVGGAPLLGVNGVGLISHGRSDALAIENAIRRAADAARAHFTDELAHAVAPSESLLAQAATADGDAHPQPTRRPHPGA
jgi:glycerol-3-phosphate acyltransferase PlsX